MSLVAEVFEMEYLVFWKYKLTQTLDSFYTCWWALYYTSDLKKVQDSMWNTMEEGDEERLLMPGMEDEIETSYEETNLDEPRRRRSSGNNNKIRRM